MITFSNIELFKRNLRLFSSLKGNEGTTKSAYLDFENQLMCLNTNRLSIKAQMPVSNDDEENIEENFSVELDLLSQVFNPAEAVVLKDKVFMYPDKDNKYKLKYTNEEFNYELLDSDFAEDDVKKFSLIFDVDLINVFKTAQQFVETDASRPLHSMFVINNHLISTNQLRFYDLNLKKFLSLDEDLPDFTIPATLYRMFSTLSSTESTRVDFTQILRGKAPEEDYEDDERIQLLKVEFYTKEEITATLVMSTNADFSSRPNISSDSFKSGYLHPDYFSVPLSEFNESLKQIEPFADSSSSKRGYLSFDTDVKKLLISVRGESNVQVSIPISDCSDTEKIGGNEISVNLSTLRTVLSCIHGEDITLRVDMEEDPHPGIDVVDSLYRDSEEPILHIVFARLQE